MSTFTKTEILSASEIMWLQSDVAALKKALKITSIAMPLILIFTALSFYFSWGSFAMFICIVMNLGTLYIMLVSYRQSRNIVTDLKENLKTVAPFILTHKKVMGYADARDQDDRGLNNRRKVRQEINISPQRIQQAIDENSAYQKEEMNTIIFNQFGIRNDDEILKYSYHYQGHFQFDEKSIEFLVPIQYYLVGNVGDMVTISYAPKSKKVFLVKK